jgi:hypothetical protein
MSQDRQNGSFYWIREFPNDEPVIAQLRIDEVDGERWLFPGLAGGRNHRYIKVIAGPIPLSYGEDLRKVAGEAVE